MTASASASLSSPLGRRRRLSLDPRGLIGEGTVGRVVLCSESLRASGPGGRSRRSTSSGSGSGSGFASASVGKVWAVKFAERAKLQHKQSLLTVERRILQRVRHRNVVKMDWFADIGDTSVIGEWM